MEDCDHDLYDGQVINVTSDEDIFEFLGSVSKNISLRWVLPGPNANNFSVAAELNIYGKKCAIVRLRCLSWTQTNGTGASSAQCRSSTKQVSAFSRLSIAFDSSSLLSNPDEPMSVSLGIVTSTDPQTLLAGNRPVYSVQYEPHKVIYDNFYRTVSKLLAGHDQGKLVVIFRPLNELKQGDSIFLRATHPLFRELNGTDDSGCSISTAAGLRLDHAVRWQSKTDVNISIGNITQANASAAPVASVRALDSVTMVCNRTAVLNHNCPYRVAVEIRTTQDYLPSTPFNVDANSYSVESDYVCAERECLDE